MITKIRHIITLAIIMVFVNTQYGQQFNIGIRAGQNYTKITGPTEPGESLNFSGGFHFGISFQYNIAENFGIKGEFLYNQSGYNQQLGSEEAYADSYFMITRPSGGLTFESGQSFLNLKVSNAYLTLPVTAQFKINRRWEVFGGPYVSVLIGPTGRGLLRFQSTDHPDEIFFRQSLDYNYNSDEAGGVPRFNRSEGAWIKVEGEIFPLPAGAGAYYQFLDKNANLFKGFDYGLTGGLNYYFNRGFYIGLRADYGLRDITNTLADRSLVELNPDNSLKYRDDSDHNFGFQASFGFKF